MVKKFPKKEKKRKEKDSLNLMICFQRKYCDGKFPFYFYFSHFGEISQLGTPKKKKKNAAAHKWAYLLPRTPDGTCGRHTRLSGSTHFVLYGPSQAQKLPAVFPVDLLKLRSYPRFFWWWTRPTTKWVCTRLFLYGPSLYSSCEEGASEADTQ